jgi:chromate reductase
MNILGIVGSLRKGSYNAATLRALQGLAPEGTNVSLFDLAPIPLYNEDVEKQGLPPSVAAFRQAIAQADAILIATPEYNYSIPGVLKNAIDWASRPPEQPFEGKPVALVGASPGFAGTTRAQHHLRQVFIYMNAQILHRPEVFIAAAHNKFDDQGNLTDDKTREQLQALMDALVTHTRQLQRGRG